MNENSKSKKIRSSFFFAMAVVAFLAIHIGFATTFLGPVANGTFNAPLVIYLHGAFAFSWILLFLVQTFLINISRFRLHMSLGFAGIVSAVGTSVTMIPAALFAVEKELKSGLGQTAISGIIGSCTSSLMFLALAFFGLYYRKQSAVHKRLLLLATIVVLWPAWFRFRHYFPSIPRPNIWFAVVLADSLIIISWLWDKKTNGHVHPVLKYVGALIILEHVFEVIMFDNEPWRKVANYFYQILN